MKVADFLDDLKVVEFATAVRNDPNGYLSSYNLLLDVAQRISAKRDETSFAGVAFPAYGWMPTALKKFDVTKVDSIENLLSTAHEAKGEEGLRKTLLLLDEHPPVNHSWVGTSKALHFLNPRVFPIWDRHVASHWNYRNSQHNKKCRYELYAKEVLGNVGHPRVAELQAIVESSHKYTATAVRTIELALFEAAPSRKAKLLKAARTPSVSETSA
jgi:hypothetical protein